MSELASRTTGSKALSASAAQALHGGWREEPRPPAGSEPSAGPAKNGIPAAVALRQIEGMPIRMTCRIQSSVRLFRVPLCEARAPGEGWQFVQYAVLYTQVNLRIIGF
jgi:hypothetical protein